MLVFLIAFCHRFNMFYNPRITVIDNIPAIVYPSKGAEKVFDRKDVGCVEARLLGLYLTHSRLFPRDVHFFIAIAWDHTLQCNEKPDPMIDLRGYNDLDGESGAQTYGRTFRSFSHETGVGEGCENAYAMLGREAEHRRGKSLDEYLEQRPQIPDWLRVGEDFYLVG